MESTTDANLSLIFDSQENNNPQLPQQQQQTKLTTRSSLNNHQNSILNEVDLNKNEYNEDELNLLNLNNYPSNCSEVRPSKRRSSILKTNLEKNEIRNSRRVSWAQTYQFKKLLEDGTTVVTSQDLDKYGPEPKRKSSEISSAFAASTIAVIAADPNGLVNCHQTNDVHDNSEENAEMVKQKVKQKVANKNYTKVLSKYYNTENKKDYQTVVNTAANRFGIDATTTDLSKLLDLDHTTLSSVGNETVGQKGTATTTTDLPNNQAQSKQDSENIKIFLKQFNKNNEKNSNLAVLIRSLEKSSIKKKLSIKKNFSVLSAAVTNNNSNNKTDDLSLEKIFTDTEVDCSKATIIDASMMETSSRVFSTTKSHNSTKLSTDQPESQDFWNLTAMDESSITINHSKDNPVEITKLAYSVKPNSPNFEIFVESEAIVPPVVSDNDHVNESIHDTTMMALTNDEDEEEVYSDHNDQKASKKQKKNDAGNFLMKLAENTGNLSTMFTDSSDDSSGLMVVVPPPQPQPISANPQLEDSQKENVELLRNSSVPKLSELPLPPPPPPTTNDSSFNMSLEMSLAEDNNDNLEQHHSKKVEVTENLEDLLEYTEKITVFDDIHGPVVEDQEDDDNNLTLTNVFTCNNLEKEIQNQQNDQPMVVATEEDLPQENGNIEPISMIEETNLSFGETAKEEPLEIQSVPVDDGSQKENVSETIDPNDDEPMMAEIEETNLTFGNISLNSTTTSVKEEIPKSKIVQNFGLSETTEFDFSKIIDDNCTKVCDFIPQIPLSTTTDGKDEFVILSESQFPETSFPKDNNRENVPETIHPDDDEPMMAEIEETNLSFGEIVKKEPLEIQSVPVDDGSQKENVSETIYPDDDEPMMAEIEETNLTFGNISLNSTTTSVKEEIPKSKIVQNFGLSETTEFDFSKIIDDNCTKVCDFVPQIPLSTTIDGKDEFVILSESQFPETSFPEDNNRENVSVAKKSSVGLVMTAEDSQKENQLVVAPEVVVEDHKTMTMMIDETKSLAGNLSLSKFEILSQSKISDSQKENLPQSILPELNNNEENGADISEISDSSMVLVSDSQKENQPDALQFLDKLDSQQQQQSQSQQQQSQSQQSQQSQSQQQNSQSQQTPSEIRGFFNGTIRGNSSRINADRLSSMSLLSMSTEKACLQNRTSGTSATGSSLLGSLPMVQLSKTANADPDLSVSFKTVPCNFNISQFQENCSKLSTPVLSSTRMEVEIDDNTSVASSSSMMKIDQETNVVEDVAKTTMAMATTEPLTIDGQLTMNDRTEFTLASNKGDESGGGGDDGQECTSISDMDMDDFEDNDENDVTLIATVGAEDDNNENDDHLSKSFQNSSNVSIVMVDTDNENRYDTKPFPHDDEDEDSVPVKVEVYEITSNHNELNEDGEEVEDRTEYVPTKPFLGKSASTLLDEEEEEDQETETEEPEQQVQEMQITEVSPSIEMVTNQSNHSDLDRTTNQTLVKSIQFDQSTTAGNFISNTSVSGCFKRPCEFPTNQSANKRSSPSTTTTNPSASTTSTIAVSSIPFFNRNSIQSTKKKTNSFNIPFSSLNMEMANLGEQLRSNSNFTTATTTTTTIMGNNNKNRSFMPLLPQIGSRRQSICNTGTTTMLNRFGNSTLTTTTSLFNRTKQPTQPQIPLTKTAAIELDFNKSQEANSSTSSKVPSPIIDDQTTNRKQHISDQYIRKSLGLNLREMLMERLNKQQEEEEEEPSNSIVTSNTETLDQTEKDCSKIVVADCSKIEDESEMMEVESMEIENNKSDASILSRIWSHSFIPTTTTISAAIGNNKDVCKDQTTTKIQPIETAALTELPMGSKSMDTTTPMSPLFENDADATYLNSIVNIDDEDDELDDEVKVYDKSMNFSIQLFSDQDEQSTTSTTTTLNRKNQLNGPTTTTITTGKEEEVSVISITESVSQNSLTLTPQSDESVFNFTLSPWRKEYSRVEDYQMMEATFECKFTQMFDVFEQANYCQTLKMDHKLYRSILRLNLDKLNIRIQQFQSDLFVARFLWSTVELRIRFGSEVVKTPKKKSSSPSPNREIIREIIALDIISLIDSKKELPQRVMDGEEGEPLYDGECYDLEFREEHREILLLAHDYVLHHFTEKRDQLKSKYRNSCDLSQLLTEISLIVSSGRKLAREIRTIYSGEVSQFIPLDSEGKFRICVELLALKKPIELHIAFNPLLYPDEVIRPTILVPDSDKHLYPLSQFSSALLIIKPGNFNYIKDLIRAARYFIKALRIVMKQIRRSRKQSEAIRQARLEPSPTIVVNNQQLSG